MRANKEAAVRELYEKLPPAMRELASKAVMLQDKIAETTDEETRSRLQRELEQINHEVILSAGDDYAKAN